MDMKNIKLIAAGLFAGFIISTAIPLAASANIIDTTHGAGAGSFELGVHSGGAFDSLAVGSTTVTGWTVGGPGDGVDWLNEPAFNASAGVRSIDLQTFFASSISTVISTVIGQTYQLTFDSTAVAPLQQSPPSNSNSTTLHSGSQTPLLFQSGSHESMTDCGASQSPPSYPVD